MLKSGQSHASVHAKLKRVAIAAQAPSISHGEAIRVRQAEDRKMALKAAWIGLGVMGYPMAGHLAAKSGARVTVYNRTAGKANSWQAEHKGSSAPTPAEAAKDQDFVFACVGNDDDLREVTLGPKGAFQTMKSGAIFIDHTTASADVARHLHAEAKSRGLGFIDAPVSGGQAGAQNGVLTVMCGGDKPDYAKAEPLIAHYSRMRKLLGPAGSGQIAKMCNQIATAGLVQGLAECIHFGMKAGLDMEQVIDVISKGAAGSWQMENRHKTMIAGKFDFGFAADWMRKDLSICLDAARRNGAQLPVTALVDQFYAEVQTMGGNRWDTSSLIARLNPPD
jgi:3-hydroxyisobutyrate dehydrogenase